MKRVLVGISMLFFLNCLLALSLPILGIEISSAFFIFVALVLFAIILFGWLRYIKALVVKSNATITSKGQKTSTWNFANLDRLKQNHELIERKLLSTA